ncbi:hypothetical protein VCHENC02_0358A, partial [Vibrio harveyi]
MIFHFQFEMLSHCINKLLMEGTLCQVHFLY